MKFFFKCQLWILLVGVICIQSLILCNWHAFCGWLYAFILYAELYPYLKIKHNINEENKEFLKADPERKAEIICDRDGFCTGTKVKLIAIFKSEVKGEKNE